MRTCRRTTYSALIAAALSLGAATRPVAAQDGNLEFADLAMGVFGVMCLLVDQPDADLAARLLGLRRAPPDARIPERMLQASPGTAWTLMNSGRFVFLARREADGACLMDAIGLDPATMQNTLGVRMSALRGDTVAVVEEDVPRPFPRPPLRARYRLTSNNASTLVEMYVEPRTVTGIPDRPLLIARPAPP